MQKLFEYLEIKKHSQTKIVCGIPFILSSSFNISELEQLCPMELQFRVSKLQFHQETALSCSAENKPTMTEDNLSESPIKGSLGDDVLFEIQPVSYF